MELRTIRLLLEGADSHEADCIARLLSASKVRFETMVSPEGPGETARMPELEPDIVLKSVKSANERWPVEVYRAVSDRAGIPVVVLIDDDSSDVLVRALAEGAQDYVAKQRLDAESLTRSLVASIERHRLRPDAEMIKLAGKAMAQAERFSSISPLYSGVAHNFNNFLQFVMAAAYVVAEDVRQGVVDEALDGLERMRISSRQAAKLVKRLQEFTGLKRHNQASPMAVVDLSEIVEQAVEMSKPYWKHNPNRQGIKVTLDRKLEPGCTVWGNNSDLLEVVTNLVRNAAEAMPQGGMLALNTRKIGETIYLSVTDTGEGIAESDLANVFVPLWTTKGFQGTGLGLASSRSIVRDHGGEMTVDSVQGCGATFTVRLPLFADSAGPAGREAGHALPSRHSVLVVDTLEPELAVLALGLRKAGQDVLTAPSEHHARHILDQSRVDAIICVGNVGADPCGRMCDALKPLIDSGTRPGIPLILLTGQALYADERERLQRAGVSEILNKPVEILTLVETLERLIPIKPV